MRNRQRPSCNFERTGNFD